MITTCFCADQGVDKISETKEVQAAWDKQVQMIRSLYKEELWKVLSPELVLTFWSLSYSDIFNPAARYDMVFVSHT